METDNKSAHDIKSKFIIVTIFMLITIFISFIMNDNVIPGLSGKKEKNAGFYNTSPGHANKIGVTQNIAGTARQDGKKSTLILTVKKGS